MMDRTTTIHCRPALQCLTIQMLSSETHPSSSVEETQFTVYDD